MQHPDLPIQKWQEVSIGFVTALSNIEGINLIMVIIDKAIRMTHLIACSKTMTTIQATQYYMSNVPKLHCIPKLIYIDRGV